MLIKKQLKVKQLRYLPEVNKNSGLLYYQLIDKISCDQCIPKSTVRWNLERLRDSGMIVAGNKEVKGVPVRLTEKGKLTLLIMDGKNLNFCAKLIAQKLYLNQRSICNFMEQSMAKQKGTPKSNKLRTEDSLESEEKFKLSLWYETRPEGP